MNDFSWVPAATILLGEHGSRGNGTYTADSDHDLTGICAEPRRFVTGLQRFDQHRFNSAGEGHRSASDDIDTAMFGLRRWAALASIGAPNALLPLFMARYEILTPAGQLLIDNRDLFLSRNLIVKYLGFIAGQRRAVLSPSSAHPELVERFGYDTKAAAAMIVAGIHGLSLVEERSMRLPLSREDINLISRVRTGQVELVHVLALGRDLEWSITNASRHTLPKVPDADAVDDLLGRVYESAWGETVEPPPHAAAFFPAAPSTVEAPSL